MQSEAVAYACGRADTLAFLFLSLGLGLFARHPWWALLSSALAMGSKESLALFPVFLALHERLAGRSIRWDEHLPFWVVSAVYIVSRLTVLNFVNILNFYNGPNLLTEHPWVRVLTYLTTIPKALQLWAWPTDLHHERSWFAYADPISAPVLIGLGVVVIMIALAWSMRRRLPGVSIGIAWFFAGTLPTSNLLVLINALFYDHWFLLPGLGLAIALASAVSAGWRRGPIARALVVAPTVALLAAWCVLTPRQNRVWRDPVSLYTHILKYEPRSAKIHNNLAMALSDQGRFDEAIALYQRAISLSDEYPQTHHNLANAYLRLGREAEATRELQRALQMDPRFHHSWLVLGTLALKHQRLDEARVDFEQAARANPYDPACYLGLAETARARGDAAEAVAALESGLQRLPNHPALRQAIQRLQSAAASSTVH